MAISLVSKLLSSNLRRYPKYCIKKMNSKIVCGVVFVFFCIFQIANAISCYRCNSEQSCKSPKAYECNQFYANQTSTFLDAHFLNVNLSATYPSYHCMRQNFKYSAGTVVYRGCVYSNIESCRLTLRPLYQQTTTVFSCNQCNNRNRCNPADRTSVSTAALIIPLVFILIYKKFV